MTTSTAIQMRKTSTLRASKVEYVLDKLKTFFTKYFGFANDEFND